MLLLGMIAGSMLTLFVSLVHSAVIAKRQAVASTLATNQMEYLRSLPYNSLAVAGGSIYSPTPLPATKTQTINGVKYKITTGVSYIDDAYDGCGSYPSQTLKQQYCRNYPPPTGAPTTDSNPADYKMIDIVVTDPGNTHLAALNTQVSARVSETASTTGALFVRVIDDTGAPVSDSAINVTNTTIAPNVNLNDNTDENGIAIFYGLPPDTAGYDYTITGSKSGYSTLKTIVPSGSLSPTYPSQNIISQSSSFVTLTLKSMTSPSLLIEATDTAGNPLANLKVYAKGGYKRYSTASDTSYCYDNLASGNLTTCATSGATDTRPTTDASGLTAISSLVPGTYIFCGDLGATSCTLGGSTYYLAAAVPYSGTNALNPIIVPISDASSPPATTFTYGGSNYLQKVRLMFSTSSSFPRVRTLTPDDVSKSSGASSFSFVVTGTNLTCSSTAASCATSVRFQQGSNTFTASCTGNSSPATTLNCTVNLSAAAVGIANMVVSNSGGTLTLPGSPLIGGLNVTP
jgi:hypothetical protein